ncbi:phage tail tube protein [Nannocystis pusilla]|uniref:Phage tail tube protein n=1 Tax=Nannocystis pusilla TaxID=889268 RepID=A0A9X3IZF4_9BACT|nr:phage tail tube protein [Nannocystis pusilla]MCY1003993.1 phage tail tube protein [Nannocystis pusilla]MCY1008519.1 phage tail tube protein [Nannocystis pusilla]
MAQKTFNIVYKINGKAADALPGGTIKFGGKTRVPLKVNGRAGVHYTEDSEAGGATIKVAHGGEGGITVAEIRSWKNVTLVAEFDSGETFQMAGAYTTNAFELSDGDGSISVELAGPEWEEI